ncbi:MAG: cysteine--tRNA ligase [Candidatus Marinimicrobia bacterium]|nr:cysteine--tRNA ligase [Candidatus Neomarinimicrobiota bacterium]
MKLQFYNSITSEKEEFKPISDNEVLVYGCGPTVYNAPHIGNFRTFIFYDLLNRVLMQNGYTVRTVINITDIDDKIIDRINSEDITFDDLTKKYERLFLDQSASLHILPSTINPRASEYISDMIDFITSLIDQGAAYEVNGNIFFDTKAYSKYGKFVNVDDGNLSTEDDGLGKKHPNDFSLWKAWKESDGEITWKSDWGNGRPAWHTECAVLGTELLGKSIDIHCGGIDLKFPHHENESAQVEALLGNQFANYWLHAEHLIFDSEKMSKSLGNTLDISDLLEQYSPETIRLFLLSSHYRSKVSFSDKKLDDSSKMIDKINRFRNNFDLDAIDTEGREYSNSHLAFLDALNDDLNTPEALGVFFDFINKMNRNIDNELMTEDLKAESKIFINLFNAIFNTINTSLPDKDDIPENIQNLASLREEMRDKSDWNEADNLREKIEKLGWIIEDTKDGQKLLKKK